MRKAVIWIAVVAVLAAGGGAWFLKGGRATAEKYLTAQVEQGDIEDSVSALGALQPFQFVDVGTQVTGQLKTLHVNVGDPVKQGDLIAEIDPTLFNARVEESRAALKLLQAQLEEKFATTRFAGEVHARNKQLFASQAASEEAVQASRAAEEQATAQVAAVRAQIQEAQSRLVADEANLRYTKIFAPMSGTVVSLTARQGQTLVSSQQAPTILRIADLRTMTVWAQVSEADVPKVKVNMPAYFNTLGLPERRWTGKVRQVMPTPETVNNVILYNVLFDVDNPDGVLKPQMSAQVFFVIAKAENVLLVPTAGLQAAGKGKGREPEVSKEKAPQSGAGKEAGKSAKEASPKAGNGDKTAAPGRKPRTYIVRVLKDGVVTERTVEVGIVTRVVAEVRSGLSVGDTVVVGTQTESGDAQKSSPRVPGARVL